MNFPSLINNGPWSNHVPQPPTSHGIGFRERAARNRSIEHSRERRKIYMLVRCIYDVLVNFICQYEDVKFISQLCNDMQFVTGKDLSRGIRGIAKHQCLWPLLECSPQFVRVEAKLGRMQTNMNRFRPAQYRISGIVFIEWRKNNNPIAGIA